MTSIYITTKSGQLVAEVNGTVAYELCDCINDLGLGFGDSFETEYDMGEDGNDIWGLIDEIYWQFNGGESYEDMAEDNSRYMG